MDFLKTPETQIQKFYKNKTILITGGTGFIGKLLVEKLLRSCPGVERIIIPMRSKNHVCVEQRIAQYFQDKTFDITKKINPNIFDKILFVNSDLEQKGCGLREYDYNIVIKSTNIVFHCAASIHLTATLTEIINSNIRVTENIVNIAKEMTDLQAFVYVSTAWSNCVKYVIEEKVCELSYKAKAFINLVDNFDEKFIQDITPIIKNKWDSLYAMSKNVNEVQIEKEKENIPVSIFRPPAVISTYKEPTSGIGPMQALSMIGAGVAFGLTKVILMNSQSIAYIVPADFVVNCMIAIPWYMVTNNRQNQSDVYNYVSVRNVVTRKTLFDSFVHSKYPFTNTVWKPGYIATNSEWWYTKYDFMCQTIPTYINDKILSKFMNRPLILRKNDMYKKCQELFHIFLDEDYDFEYNNVPALWKSLTPEDKQLFMFDLDSLDWKDVLDKYTRSIKKFVEENLRTKKTVKSKY